MLITEAELREYWQNGRGTIPSFPPGTRFTPSAQDFLKSQGVLAAEVSSDRMDFAASPDGTLLKSPHGKRLIITAHEIDQWIPAGTQKIILHPSVTITDAAREKLRASGVRLVPFVECAPQSTSVSPEPSRQAPDIDTVLFQQVKAAVIARLETPVDEAILDAVLKKVITNLTGSK